MDKELAQPGLFARQPLSTLSKIALWAFIVGAIGGIAGAVALTITSGSPSQNIVVTMVLSLACVILLATGMRWTPVLTTVLGGYNFYLALTEPFIKDLQVNGNSVEIGPFTTAGTYHIYCTVHQGMNLTIVVQ